MAKIRLNLDDLEIIRKLLNDLGVDRGTDIEIICEENDVRIEFYHLGGRYRLQIRG